MGREGIDRNDNFYFLSFLAFPNTTWRETQMFFYNFLNFFAIFLNFSITGRVGIDRNDNFCFLSFSVFPYLFWLEEKP